MRETTRWADFALTAVGQRGEGALAEAEQLLRSGLDAQPDSAEGALVLALVLLDGDRGEEAREVLERCVEASRDQVAADGSDTGEVFTDRVSDSELDSAFESAETNRDEMFDADAVAQRAMRETESDFSEELASPTSSFATRTVAELLEKQGDERGASRIRAIVDSPAGTEPGAANSRDRHDQTIEQLERWLVNLRGASK